MSTRNSNLDDFGNRVSRLEARVSRIEFRGLSFERLANFFEELEERISREMKTSRR